MTPASVARLSPVPRSFYARDPRLVARELLGKLLVRRLGAAEYAALESAAHPEAGRLSPGRGGHVILAGRIVETEAYLGAVDPGAHSYGGRTPRNAVLFGEPGHAYVYFIYGNHYCTNVSCQPAGDAGGVLFRALEPVCGVPAMAGLRGLTLGATPRLSQLRLLTSGPGRLSQALGINRQRDNGGDLCSRAGGLYIVGDGSPPAEIAATPRINVTRAPLDEWRFVVTGNPFVSGKKLG